MGESLKGRTALVTGASGGIGADLARELARRGADLVLVARRKDALAGLAAELRERHGVEVAVRPADLATAGARERLAEALSGSPVDILVNNAGFGVFGRFADTAWDRLDSMLELDVVALTHLTRLFLPAMIARGRGRVLLIASTAAYQPVPFYAAYGAAKAYVLSFGVAVNRETRGTGVTCTTLCPGVTATDFFHTSGQKPTLFQRLTTMQSARVAAVGVRAMLTGRSSVVVGPLNAAVALSMRPMPRELTASIAARLMRN